MWCNFPEITADGCSSSHSIRVRNSSVKWVKRSAAPETHESGMVAAGMAQSTSGFVLPNFINRATDQPTAHRASHRHCPNESIGPYANINSIRCQPGIHLILDGYRTIPISKLDFVYTFRLWITLLFSVYLTRAARRRTDGPGHRS
jgi:hypothetical protein